MIKVIIADDHHLVLAGIRALLEKTQDIEVIAEAADGLEAVELVEKLRPDVVVIDIGMPKLSMALSIASGDTPIAMRLAAIDKEAPRMALTIKPG